MIITGAHPTRSGSNRRLEVGDGPERSVGGKRELPSMTDAIGIDVGSIPLSE
jgi:hypothetical protein